jgi:hypothetical protein
MVWPGEICSTPVLRWINAGAPAARAPARAAGKSAVRVTVVDQAPQAAAEAAKSGFLSSVATTRPWELALLVHADRAVGPVVDHHHHDVGPVLDGGGQLLPRHEKSPSPAKHTTSRPGAAILAATAAGKP